MAHRTVLLPLLVLATALALPAGETAPRIETAALRISRPLARPGDAPGALPAAFGAAGTSVVLLVELPGASLLAFDSERSTLAALADDRGTDLRGAADERRLLPPLGVDFLAEGGTTALIVVHGQQVPGAGASSIRAAGTLVFSSGGTPDIDSTAIAVTTAKPGS